MYHPRGGPSKRRWCSVLAAVLVFVIILAVMVIAGLAIYMGALRLEVSQILVLDGSFRVVGGDTYNISLMDHSSPLFQRKSQIYKSMIESIFRRTEFSSAIKQCNILGFKNGSVIVFFRLILDRRKIPRKPTPVEEQIKAILLQRLPGASPLKNFKVDKSQVFLKRVGENASQSQMLGDQENKNQSLEIHNGLLRKSPPKIITSHYTNPPVSQPQIPKTTSTTEGVIGGSFKLSEPDQTKKSSQTTQKSSSQEHQTSQTINKNSRNNVTSSIDFYQHSPALHALLKHKARVESTSTAIPEIIEPTLSQDETDLITLLPYIFQGVEEPWKPVLPENFTRYPERRPLVTEDYSSGGVGVVEVVLDPDDLASSIPSKPNLVKEENTQKQYLNLANPVSSSSLSYPIRPVSSIGKETFGPRSDNKVSFVLNTEDENNEKNHYEQFRNIFIKHKDGSELRENVSPSSGILPDLPIIQQFHNLDALLRSYSLKSLNPKADDDTVTLLPARSNLDMKKQIRPRPSPTSSSEIGDRLIEVIQDMPKIIHRKLAVKVNSGSVDENSNTNVSTSTEQIDGETNTTVFYETAIEIHTEASTAIEREVNIKDQFKTSSNTEPSEDSETSTQPEDLTYIQLANPSTEHLETVSLYQNNPKETNPSGSLHHEKYVKIEPNPTEMTFRNNRQSKMSPTFLIGGVPLKIDLKGNIDEVSVDGKMNEDRNNSKVISHSQEGIVKLKDVKIQDVLEKIIYNLTSPDSADLVDSPLEQDLKITDFQNQNLSENDDPSIALNRKFGQNTADSKNNLFKNSSLVDMKPDLIFYYLKHQNKSSLNSQGLGLSNSYVKNGNSEASNKTSPNYKLNKDGFLMLTKVYNKASSSPTNNELTKSNSTRNQTVECTGNTKMRCGSGECISSLSRCNHLVDCADGTDEKNCSCADFLRAQYLTRKICDGVVDCWDFSDENNCDWCTSGQYVCSNSRVCIDQERVCNGHPDCPNGDDEKNCVSIAPDISQADNIKYHTSGTLMIRKEGQWGKLCTQNFDDLNSIFKSRWTLEDLGRVVCKTMTFRTFEGIEHINDTTTEGVHANKFYELTYSKDSAAIQSRLGLTFGNTTCSQRKVVHVSCGSLECGVRPQAHRPWERSKRGGSRHSRIVGGGNAGPGSWPWLAALYKEGEFQCGATLISDRWLLSAGHCFYHALDDHWVARLGALRRGTNLPSPYEQLRVVSRILLHPHYVDAGFINDISLLQLREPVTLTDYVRPICLPQPNVAPSDGTMCTVIGWGQLFEVGRIFPDTLQEVQLPVISTSECRKRTLFLPLYKVTENMFCAGYDRGGRDACLGDSGGPLMCQENDGHWSLMGVTSNGYGCARANRPGVYTKVANYISWVHSSMSAGDALTPRRNTTCNGHRCPLGECLPSARICNGFMECSDGSDEKDCW
ncbi:uncharacterized protein LOC128989379 [Macrosteles quadrilineatus]|uniref:uncharacterized protein LOC128989379 n=1 Tax=Macrosteles quadrilineatus TaxID=74068 RepID=UPI0023E0B6FB|nr:uncharacterized protein LOC128989379 [Macrosteles quadrilineatus]